MPTKSPHSSTSGPATSVATAEAGALQSVSTAVHRVLRHGLPVNPNDVDPALLALRGVTARAADANSRESRTAALDGLLRRTLAAFNDARYAAAARALFGLPPATAGQTWTARRALAAHTAGHELHHFRKRVEPRLVEQLAWALLKDTEAFTRSRAIAPRLTAATSRQAVPADVFAWEVAEHEEALARLWSAVYTLRAELLATERALSMDMRPQTVTRQRLTAAWRFARLHVDALHYLALYGTDLDGTGRDFTAADMTALAGWTPPLSETDLDELATLASTHPDEDDFVAALAEKPTLLERWTGGFQNDIQTPR